MFDFLNDKREPRKFDVVIGNPPYQGPGKSTDSGYEGGGKGSRNSSLWPSFVEKCFDLVEADGFVCMIHPPRWRKPGDKTGDLIRSKNVLHIDIHGKSDGMKTFNCMVRYDWYIAQNSPYKGSTVVRDENGDICKIDLSDFSFLPHSQFDLLRKIVAKGGEETCQVICDSSYHNQRDYMSRTQDDKYKYPCVYSTTKDAVKYFYSSTNQNGHFGAPKVIFGENGGDTGIYNAILDLDGKFGMTEGGIAIIISSKEEGENVISAIQSEKFTTFIRACNYGGFRIDWKIFRYFRKDFWKEFVDENGNEI